MTNPAIPAEAVEAAARAMAILKDEDGCFLEVDAWNAREEWDREAHPESYPGSDIEDCAYWLEKARAALEAAAPYLRAGALEDAADEMTERVSAIEQMVVEEWMYDALCAMREQAIRDLAWLRERAVAERGGE